MLNNAHTIFKMSLINWKRITYYWVYGRSILIFLSSTKLNEDFDFTCREWTIKKGNKFTVKFQFYWCRLSHRIKWNGKIILYLDYIFHTTTIVTHFGLSFSLRLLIFSVFLFSFASSYFCFDHLHLNNSFRIK